MLENEISGEVVRACYDIHVGLGPVLFESVYEEVLTHQLEKRGLHVIHQR